MPSANTSPRHRAGSRRLGAAALATVIAVAGAARAADATVTVMLDRAQVMRFPPTTETVVVGNPIIADVAMLRNSGEVILTGKGYGDTNLLFLDGHGTVLSETELRVREPPSTLVVQRGTERETYACHPRCQPTVTLGDSADYLGASAKAVKLRNSLASGAAAAPPGGGQ